jgi:hypothetical protein
MIPLLAAFGSILSAGISAFGKSREADASAKAAEEQADNEWDDANFADRNAALVQARSADDERRYRVMARREMGSMTNVMAASGLTGGEELLQEAASESEENALNIRTQGRLEAGVYRQESARKRNHANQLRDAANDIRSGGSIAAIGTILGGTASGIGYAYEKMPSLNRAR